MEEPGGLLSMGSHRIGHDWSDLAAAAASLPRHTVPFLNIPTISSSLYQSVQSLSRVRLFVTRWTAARQASLSITNSQSLPKLMSIELMMPSNHPFLCHPFSSRLQSFPASGSFPMNPLFTSDGQSLVGSASASVLPVNIQG